MKFVGDESVERHVVERLRGLAHDIIYIHEHAAGIDDDAVLDIAVAEQRILITGDKDFGELVFRLGRASAGVLLLRLSGLSNESKAETVAQAVTIHEKELAGAFSVIEPGRIRIRKP